MKIFSMIAIILALISVPVFASPTCRAYEAAKIGSEAGFNVDKKAAAAWEQSENSVVDALQECIGDITHLQLPTFPDLSILIDKIISGVCQAARDKIHDKIPENIDPWDETPFESGQHFTVPASFHQNQNTPSSIFSLY